MAKWFPWGETGWWCWLWSVAGRLHSRQAPSFRAQTVHTPKGWLSWGWTAFYYAFLRHFWLLCAKSVYLAQLEILPLPTLSFWRRRWHPAPVLLPGKSHGRRSLVGYSPWGREESDTTEQLHFTFTLPFISRLRIDGTKSGWNGFPACSQVWLL